MNKKIRTTIEDIDLSSSLIIVLFFGVENSPTPPCLFNNVQLHSINVQSFMILNWGRVMSLLCSNQVRASQYHYNWSLGSTNSTSDHTIILTNLCRHNCPKIIPDDLFNMSTWNFNKWTNYRKLSQLKFPQCIPIWL